MKARHLQIAEIHIEVSPSSRMAQSPFWRYQNNHVVASAMAIARQRAIDEMLAPGRNISMSSRSPYTNNKDKNRGDQPLWLAIEVDLVAKTVPTETIAGLRRPSVHPRKIFALLVFSKSASARHRIARRHFVALEPCVKTCMSCGLARFDVYC